MATLQEQQAQAMEPAMIGSQSQQPVKQQASGTATPPPIGHQAMNPVGGSAYPTTDPSLYGSMQQQFQNYQVPEGYAPMQAFQGTMTPGMQSQLDAARQQQMAMQAADMQRQKLQQQQMEAARARQLQQQQQATAGAISPLGGAMAGSVAPGVMRNAMPMLQAMGQRRGYAENPQYRMAQQRQQQAMARQMAGMGNYGGNVGSMQQNTANMDMAQLMELYRQLGMVG